MANEVTPIQFPAYIVRSWVSLMKDPTKNDTALRMEGVQIERALNDQLTAASKSEEK